MRLLISLLLNMKGKLYLQRLGCWVKKIIKRHFENSLCLFLQIVRRRQFAWEIKGYFLGNISIINKKNISKMSSLN